MRYSKTEQKIDFTTNSLFFIPISRFRGFICLTGGINYKVKQRPEKRSIHKTQTPPKTRFIQQTQTFPKFTQKPLFNTNFNPILNPIPNPKFQPPKPQNTSQNRRPPNSQTLSQHP